jgi:hypothetical protein
MIIKLNHLLDELSEFIARRKGLLPVLGILLIMGNYVIQFIPWFGWFSTSNFLLHFGIVLAIIGVLLAWAL